MNNNDDAQIPVEMNDVLQKLQRHPQGAIYLELAMTQVALDQALQKIKELENGSRPVEPAKSS